MPHLAPLSWLLAPIIFWSALLFIIVFFWWSQLPKMPPLSPKSENSYAKISNWQWTYQGGWVKQKIVALPTGLTTPLILFQYIMYTCLPSKKINNI